ncbi:MAG TPA: uracil-DNA glycosylase [Smithellaceae bacterium]|nr:uracil-DNA glycosylase [Smithellaceae bacterium]HRV44308.1 uracil-DNA glycosylase [Smithellaceae bacterium]
MTDVLSPSSPEEIRRQLLSVVKSLKGQVRNADHFYVSVDVSRPRPGRAQEEPGTPDPWRDLSLEVAGCGRCALSRTRKNVVFGVGSLSAQVVFVGEAPGADEDEQGEPFVGRAGQLLTDIIVKGMKLARKDVYICNILKCRPPGNRNPLPEEIRQCEPFLKRQLQLIGPRVICALGKFAAQTLLKTEAPITALRGRFRDYEGIKLMPTYHPAYLLRNPSAKKQVWEDVQQIMKEIGLGGPS